MEGNPHQTAMDSCLRRVQGPGVTVGGHVGQYPSAPTPATPNLRAHRNGGLSVRLGRVRDRQMTEGEKVMGWVEKEKWGGRESAG